MDSKESTVVFESGSRTEALLVNALLTDAGLVTYVPGLLLTDEFAAAQEVASGGAFRIEVAADQLERAQTVIEEARLAGESMESGEDGEGEGDGDE